jgi:NADP-dependent 3-hydroxy acid dehydrogenase YdfG
VPGRDAGRDQAASHCDLAGQVALVTGASKGIGAGIYSATIWMRARRQSG